MKWNIECLDINTQETAKHSICDSNINIGRSSSNKLTIKNDFISREHLILSSENEIIFAQDCNSANGSYIFVEDHWFKFKGKIKIDLPARIRLGDEIILNIVSSIAQNEVLDNQPPAQSETAENKSQVVNIKDLAHDDCIMVLDLCDSSQIASTDDAMALHLKNKLESITLPAIKNFNYNFYKNTGDGFLACFHNAKDALNAVKQIFCDIDQRNKRTKNLPIRIRVALHKGKTYRIQNIANDIHGSDVNIAFRIDSLKNSDFINQDFEIQEKDRILCSRSFYDEAWIFKKDFCITKVGHAQLKGIEGQHEIFIISLL